MNNFVITSNLHQAQNGRIVSKQTQPENTVSPANLLLAWEFYNGYNSFHSQLNQYDYQYKDFSYNGNFAKDYSSYPLTQPTNKVYGNYMEMQRFGRLYANANVSLFPYNGTSVTPRTYVTHFRIPSSTFNKSGGFQIMLLAYSNASSYPSGPWVRASTNGDIYTSAQDETGSGAMGWSFGALSADTDYVLVLRIDYAGQLTMILNNTKKRDFNYALTGLSNPPTFADPSTYQLSLNTELQAPQSADGEIYRLYSTYVYDKILSDAEVSTLTSHLQGLLV